MYSSLSFPGDVGGDLRILGILNPSGSCAAFGFISSIGTCSRSSVYVTASQATLGPAACDEIVLLLSYPHSIVHFTCKHSGIQDFYSS